MKSLFFFTFSKLLKKIATFCSLLARQEDQKKFHLQKVLESTSYNMYSEENEKYYAEQYLLLLKNFLPKDSNKLTIYDLGCGQGRLTFCLSKYYKKSFIVGCDISPKAIKFANLIKNELNLNKRIMFELKSIKEFIKIKKKNSANLIIITEVGFFYPELDKIFPSLLRLLKPGGIIAISYRPEYFYASLLVRKKLFENLKYLLFNKSGNIMNSPITFCWKSSHDVINFYKKYKIKILEICGIGCFSGIADDPNENIAQPKNLNIFDKNSLMKNEVIFGKKYPDSGRYIFAIGKKP